MIASTSGSSLRRFIDLTGKIENNLWSYAVLAGNENTIPPVKIVPIASIAENGFFASQICLSTLSGTYLEAGSHVFPDGRTLDSYPVDQFIRPASIIHLPRCEARATIDAAMLELYSDDFDEGDAMLIDTGWGQMWNDPGYVLTCPSFTQSGVEWITDRRPSILGVDVPCIESAWSDNDDQNKGELLKKIYNADILLVAPLVRLETIQDSRGTVFCLPLYVSATSGAPVRVVFEAKS